MAVLHGAARRNKAKQLSRQNKAKQPDEIINKAIRKIAAHILKQFCRVENVPEISQELVLKWVDF